MNVYVIDLDSTKTRLSEQILGKIWKGLGETHSTLRQPCRSDPEGRKEGMKVKHSDPLGRGGVDKLSVFLGLEATKRDPCLLGLYLPGILLSMEITV